MLTKTNSYRVTAIISLVLIMLLTVVLAACDTGSTENDPTKIVVDFDISEEESDNTVSQDEQTPEGYTERPVVHDIINIAPDLVTIGGTCEEGAIISIDGGKEHVEVTSRNGYFITEVTLSNISTTLLEAVATVEGKEPSLPLSFTADYNATAEKRLDGFGVSIGPDSYMYFDSFLDNYMGENLLTQTQLRKFKKSVNDRIINIESRAGGQDVDIIYVLIPDVTSIYPDIFGSDLERATHTTRYKQIADALVQTDAVMIDMYDKLIEAKESGEYEIYRRTDSNLTEYGGYLVYSEIAEFLAKRFPAAAPRPLEEFEITEIETIGGNIAEYLGLTAEHYVEDIIDLQPNFSLKMGLDEDSGFGTVNIGDVKKYNSTTAPFDYSVYDKAEKNAVGVGDRMIIRTGREDLPSALIYRDDGLFMSTDILAERFNNMMFGKSEDFTINLTDAGRHFSAGKTFVDYILVIVTENNILNILG